MFILFLSTAISMIGFGVIFPLLPAMQEKFFMSDEELGYLASIFAISGFIGTIFFGYLSDKIGRKKILYIPFLLEVVVYALTAYATTYMELMILRGIAGILAGNISVAFAAAADVSTEETKFKNMGMLGAGFGLGFMFGPAIGGFLAGNSNDLALVNLELPFLFSAAITLIPALLLMFFFKESLSVEDRKIDSQNNILDNLLTLFKNKKILFFIYLNILLSLVLSGIEVYLGPWLKTHFDFTSMNIGNYWAVFSLLITISQLGLSRLLKAKTAMIVGFFVFGLSQIMLLLSESSLYLLYFNTVLMAFAMGIIFPSINVSISSEGKKNQQGLIFGINQSVGSIGRILGPLLLGFAYAIEPNYAWILVGVLSILTGIFTIFFLKDNN